jgi:hypothetical protein
MNIFEVSGDTSLSRLREFEPLVQTIFGDQSGDVCEENKADNLSVDNPMKLIQCGGVTSADMFHPLGDMTKIGLTELTTQPSRERVRLALDKEL